MTWSFQLYSARNFQPWSNVLKTLGELGYEQVEGFAALYDDPKGLRAELDRNGLSMPSGHFSMDLLESDFGQARQIADALGVQLMVCPYIAADQRPDSAEAWRAFGERLERVCEAAKLAGFDFAWHNHNFEFGPLPDGSLPMTHILAAAPDIGWEIDVAWVIRGGADPHDWIDRYGPRITAVHVKDIAPPGEAADEDGWADIGHGTVDWKGLIADLRARTRAKFFVLEHDNPSDYRRFARRSIETARIF